MKESIIFYSVFFSDSYILFIRLLCEEIKLYFFTTSAPIKCVSLPLSAFPLPFPTVFYFDISRFFDDFFQSLL